MTTTFRDQRITLQRGGHHVLIKVGGKQHAVTRHVAGDLALALDSASAGALPSLTAEAPRKAA